MTVNPGDTVTKGVIRLDRLFQLRAGTTVARADNALRFTCTPPQSQCSDCGGGTCSTSFLCRGWGTGVNDPAKVDVRRAVGCSTTATTNGPTLTAATAGIPRSFAITVRDAASNLRDSNTDALMARATLGVSPILTAGTGVTMVDSTIVSVPTPGYVLNQLGGYIAT